MDIYNIQLCKLMYSYITGTLLTQLQILVTNNSLVHSHQTRHSQDPHSIARKTSSAAINFYLSMAKSLVSFARRREELQVIQPTSKKYYLSTY